MQGFIAQVITGLATGAIYALLVLAMNVMVLVRDIVHIMYTSDQTLRIRLPLHTQPDHSENALFFSSPPDEDGKPYYEKMSKTIKRCNASHIISLISLK